MKTSVPLVLLVDDEPAIRESLAFALKRDGFAIAEAASLREAEQAHDAERDEQLRSWNRHGASFRR